MNLRASEAYFKYEPSQDVCKAARHVTLQYKTAHSAATSTTAT